MRGFAVSPIIFTDPKFEITDPNQTQILAKKDTISKTNSYWKNAKTIILSSLQNFQQKKT